MSTILIVDDEKGIRAGLSTAIARVGHRAVVAADNAPAGEPPRGRLEDGFLHNQRQCSTGRVSQI